MFNHIMIGASDVAASKAFYDAILGELGHKPGVMDDLGRCVYVADGNVFILTPPIDGNPASHGNGCTVAFAARDKSSADAWHAAGVANGGTSCEDPPGERPGSGYYLAYLRDPSGIKVCALHHLS